MWNFQFLPSIPLLLSHIIITFNTKGSLYRFGDFFQKSVRTSDLFYSTKDGKKKRDGEKITEEERKGRRKLQRMVVIPKTKNNYYGKKQQQQKA